jgi:toluene monooxygenase system protein B
MALFPIYGRFVGDFVPHLVAVDTDDTMTEVAAKVAAHSVGRRIPERPDAAGYEVLFRGAKVPDDTRLGSLGPRPLEWFDVRFRA